MPYKVTAEYSIPFKCPAPETIDGQEECEVNEILAERRHGHKCQHQYLVSWKGYPGLDNSWVNEEDLHTSELLQEFHAAHLSIRTPPPHLRIDIPLPHSHPFIPKTFLPFETSHPQQYACLPNLLPTQPPPYALATTINSLALQLRIIPIVMPVQYVPTLPPLPCSPPSPRFPCAPPLMRDPNGLHQGSTLSLQLSLNWGLTHPRVPLPRALTPPQTVSRVTQMEVSVLSWRTLAPMTFRRHCDTSNSNAHVSASNRSRKRSSSSKRELTRQRTSSRRKRSWSSMPT